MLLPLLLNVPDMTGRLDGGELFTDLSINGVMGPTYAFVAKGDPVVIALGSPALAFRVPRSQLDTLASGNMDARANRAQFDFASFGNLDFTSGSQLDRAADDS